MVIDSRTPEGQAREARNATLGFARRSLQDAASELEYLINGTPSGDRRNALCDANIHVSAALDGLHALPYEEAGPVVDGAGPE